MFSFLFTREISEDLGQPVNCISMSNDGNCILAGCLDSTVRLLDRYVWKQFGEIYCGSLSLPVSLSFLVTGLQVNYCRNIKATLIRLVCRCLNLVVALSIVPHLAFPQLIVGYKLTFTVICIFAFLVYHLLTPAISFLKHIFHLF